MNGATTFIFSCFKMSHIMRRPAFRVSDQAVQSQSNWLWLELQVLDLRNRGIVLSTLKFLNFGTTKIFAVIYLKFKQRGQTLRQKKNICVFPVTRPTLIFPSDPKVFIGIPKKMKFYQNQPTLFATIFYWFCHFHCHI